MDFGSKFVYNYSDSEEEVVSEDELEDGLTAWTDTRPGGRRFTSTGHDSSSSSDEDTADYPRLARGPAPARTASVPLAFSKTGKRPLSLGGIPPPPSIPLPPPPPPVAYSNVERSGGSKEEKRQKKKKTKKSHHWVEADGREQQSKIKYENVRGRRCRRADTNVLCIKFGELTELSNMHTGDPVYCDGCAALLSHISNTREQHDHKVWVCEFCEHVNTVDVEEEEIPRVDNVTYMITPAPCTTSGGRSGLDQSLIIFCIDTSGSMCVTTEVPGRVRLRGDHTDRLQTLNPDHRDQYMPGQRRDVTFVSRLQGVQAAVDNQLRQMAKDHPDRRAALISFNSEVQVVGDGHEAPVHLAGDKLHNMEQILTAGKSLTLPQPISHTRKQLSDKIFDLEEGGQTALGPALLLAVSMAGQVTGSKVIICTDGMANVGLGSLDNLSQSDYDVKSGFYQELSQCAVDNGVSVSVTTIQGTNCKLAELGQVAANTGGQVNIVDPMKLTEEFGNILADSLIATNVQATLILHKALYLRDEGDYSSKKTQQIGNVTQDTEITFEYGIRKPRKNKKKHKPTDINTIREYPKEEAEQDMDTTENTTQQSSAEPIGKATTSVSTEPEDPQDSNSSMSAEPKEPQTRSVSAEPEAGASTEGVSGEEDGGLSNMTEVPFQLQLVYTDLDGAQAIRVITQSRPVTNDRGVAEQEMNPVLLGVHGRQQSANMALAGEYTNSRLNAFMYHRLMYRNLERQSVQDVYGGYLQQAAPMDSHLHTVQRQEVMTKGRTYSDEEDSEDDYMPESQGAPARSSGGSGVLSKAKALFGFSSKPPATSRHMSAPVLSHGGKKVAKKAFVSRRMECPDISANIFYTNARSSSSDYQPGKKQ